MTERLYPELTRAALLAREGALEHFAEWEAAHPAALSPAAAIAAVAAIASLLFFGEETGWKWKIPGAAVAVLGVALAAAGGGLVRVTLSGKGEMKRLSIDPSLMKPEEREIVEDLIVAAHADAKAKAERKMAEEMQKLAGSLGLPPGMTLPGL